MNTIIQLDSTPILFLIFNRFENTKKVFEAIKIAKPTRLYIASDGPRDGHSGEEEVVLRIRNYLLSEINWACEVKTLFRDKNLGCKYAVSSAIDWFFENEEMGIILEDDCLPNQSFFSFCAELLLRYKDDFRVWHISGDNFQNGITRGDADYYFSKYNHIWGWATWANRWKSYNVELSQIPDDQFIERIFLNKNQRTYWSKIFQSMKAGSINTWDYQWLFCMWYNEGIAVLPSKNLISNVGFGSDATHTILQGPFSNLAVHDLKISTYVDEVVVDENADLYTESIMYTSLSLFKRICYKLNIFRGINGL
jgi:hypothetical protein